MGRLSSVSSLLSAARRSPSLALFNMGQVALFPHQERAFLDALSRWPIRVMLADEVGLGKTFEAASIVSFAVRFLDVRRVTALVPAGVIRQWQEELWLHFGLEFWRYDSGDQTFYSPTEGTVGIPRGVGPVGSHAPALSIVSTQLARGTRRDGDAFESADELPDFLLVDEAHAARVNHTADGRRHPTLLWRLLDRALLANPPPTLAYCNTDADRLARVPRAALSPRVTRSMDR